MESIQTRIAGNSHFIEDAIPILGRKLRDIVYDIHADLFLCEKDSNFDNNMEFIEKCLLEKYMDKSSTLPQVQMPMLSQSNITTLKETFPKLNVVKFNDKQYIEEKGNLVF